MIDDARGSWTRVLLVVLAALVALAMAACGGDDEGEDDVQPSAQEPEAPEDEANSDGEDEESADGAGGLTVVATEYQFDFPALLAAGPATFTLQNDGKQPHHLILAKLTDDAPPIEKLVKMRNADKFIEEDITGNNPPMAQPGQTASTPIETELTPGTYGYVCFLPDKEKKKPHAFLGMAGTFRVQ